MKRVYVAGAIGINDPGRAARCARGIQAGRDLVRAGFSPMVQHFYTACDDGTRDLADYSGWMEIDGAWLDVADAVLRIPGESPGADREVTRAQLRGIPVFYCIGDLLDHARFEGWALARCA